MNGPNMVEVSPRKVLFVKCGIVVSKLVLALKDPCVKIEMYLL